VKEARKVIEDGTISAGMIPKVDGNRHSNAPSRARPGRRSSSEGKDAGTRCCSKCHNQRHGHNDHKWMMLDPL